MRRLKLSKAFTLMESGPVVLVTTHDGQKNNIMTISWTMVLDFTPVFAITTGEWNHSFAALRKNRECVIAIPTVDLLIPHARRSARFTLLATVRSLSTGARLTGAR